MRNHLIAAIVFCAMSIACPVAAQVQGGWSTTGTLSSGVIFNTQVSLSNGSVLVAGGSDGTNYLATAQLYHPSTGVWTPTGSMATGRDNSAAVVLANGKVLVEGGLGSGAAILASAELYDPSTAKWSHAGAMSVARFAHTATLLATGPQKGKVLVTGGCSSRYCSAFTTVSEIYDPVTNVWTTVGPLNSARYYHTATPLNNGKVLVVGGFNGSSMKTSELYNPTSATTGTWTTVRSTSIPRYQHAATLLSSGKVLVTGGRCGNGCVYPSAEIYNPTANTWTPTGNMKLGRALHSAVPLANNTVLVAAGGVMSGCGRSFCLRATATAEIYDVASGTFSAAGSLKAGRMNQSASLLKSGQVMLVGGQSITYNVLSSAEIYTPLTLTIAPASLTFGLKLIGVSTAPQIVAVTNVSRSSVTFNTIAVSGDFAQTNNCPATLASGKKCVITVTFKPTAAGTRTGAVTLKDNSDGSPAQTIALTGTGEQYAIGFSPASLSFPTILPGNHATLSATITNDSALPVNITRITITPASGTFTQTNSCPATLNPNQTCMVQVIFTPPDSIPFTATLQIFDKAKGSPHLLPLAGAGLD